MQCISGGYEALELQWTALSQSPNNGIALLTKLRNPYPSVPIVLYSRKITSEGLISVLEAGAADTIREQALKSEQLLARLAAA